MGTYREWDQKDVDLLEELCEKDVSIESMCKTLDRSRLSILNQLKKMDQETPTEATDSAKEIESETPRIRRTKLENAAVSFLDRNLKDKDHKKLWASILDFQGALEAQNIEQKQVSIEIKSNKWIGVAMVGDLHIGNMSTNYKKMLEHRDMMAGVDNLYIMLNGDYVDNFIPTSHAAGMFEALFPPKVQKDMALDYIQKIKDQVLVLVAGCHEAFGIKAADFDLSEYLARYTDAAYLGDGGIVHLTIGKVKYKVNIRHKYKYSNMENPTASVKKLFEKTGGFDVGVISHNHVACMEEAVKEGGDGYQKRLFIRAGTYKTHDRYGRQLGFSEGDIGVPIVLFNPAKRDIRGFQDLQEGIEYLAYLNK